MSTSKQSPDSSADQIARCREFAKVRAVARSKALARRLLLVATLLAGCGSTGVIPTGDDEYMIAKTDVGDVWQTGTKVLAKLYIEANAFCASKNSQLERISEETANGQPFVRNASATLRFRCKSVAP